MYKMYITRMSTMW